MLRRNYDFFVVTTRNCVAFFRNYGPAYDRSYVVTTQQFYRNEVHLQVRPHRSK